MHSEIFIWLIVSFISGGVLTFLAIYRPKPPLRLDELIETTDRIAMISNCDYQRQRRLLSEVFDYMITEGDEDEVSAELLRIIAQVKDEFKNRRK